MLKVNVGVELNKARVELTSEQRGSVETFVQELLLGKSTSSNGHSVRKGPSRRIFGRREWTQEEETRFLDLIQMHGATSKNQSDLLKIAGRQLGRTPHSLVVRLSIIRRGKGLNPASSVPQFTKNSPSNSGPTNERPTDLHR